jgi:protocatechuate 4,5-dioxygenase alpha chain
MDCSHRLPRVSSVTNVCVAGDRHAAPMISSFHAAAFDPGAEQAELWGTTLFDGRAATRGYALNKMCFSFNDAANRAAFLQDEAAYCRRFGLDAEQCEAVRRRDVLALIAAGGNIYYLAKLAGIFGLDVQDIGAQQTGCSVDEFRAMLRAAAD